MFNLLTVIIAVALSGFMAAAGVFYGGSAFTQSGPKAAAMGVIQGMAQVDAAWVLYTADANTTDTTVPATATLITGNYLAAVPTAPTNAATFGGLATNNVFETDLITANPDTAQTGIYLVLNSSSLSVCTEIARAGGQVSSSGNLAAPGTGLTLTGIVTPAAFTAAFATSKFGCIALGAVPTTLAIGGTAFVAGDGGATPKYVAYFKH